MYNVFMPIRNRFFYLIKPLVPRKLQLRLRRWLIKRKLPRVKAVWPIDPVTASAPAGWGGWPDNKRFVFLPIHDVDTGNGLEKCSSLMDIEEFFGFRSTFNIVPENYPVPIQIREEIITRGFGLGVHGLKHDGKMFLSKRIFSERAKKINHYLKEWDTRGYSSPSMLHNLSWMHELDIDYDISTFDTDPFEPQTDPAGTLFPFIVEDNDTGHSYVELPYTMPQDFTLFVLMEETTIDIWKRKLDWIAENGGMVLVNTHPDYMELPSALPNRDAVYPTRLYKELLAYILQKYNGLYWCPLPCDIVSFCRENEHGLMRYITHIK